MIRRKELITLTFERLGADAVERGLTASGYLWGTCFLSRAVGSEQACSNDVQRWTGLSLDDLHGVALEWDTQNKEFRNLAREWLELNRVPQRVPVCSPTA